LVGAQNMFNHVIHRKLQNKHTAIVAVQHFGFWPSTPPEHRGADLSPRHAWPLHDSRKVAGACSVHGLPSARRSPPANPRPVSESARDLERAVMVPVDHGRRSARRRYTAAPGLNRGFLTKQFGRADDQPSLRIMPARIIARKSSASPTLIISSPMG